MMKSAGSFGMSTMFRILLAVSCFIHSESLPESLKLEPGQCWGYEINCNHEDKIGDNKCDSDVTHGWNDDKDPQTTFYRQADFGYIRDKLKSIKSYCNPNRKKSSSLRCTDNLEFCRGSDLSIDFSKLLERNKFENVKYKMDIFSPGDIQLTGCNLDSEKLDANLDFMSPLQSWAPEFRNIISIDQPLRCDITFDDPVIVMKLDATVNMYHHYCDFFNLYLSLHMNHSLGNMHPHNWSTANTRILILENTPAAQNSPFSDSWVAFSDLPLIDLTDVAGKKVCFKQVMFPLLARMIFGLYYNTPLIDGCQGSEMMRKFSLFMREKLQIHQQEILKDKRVRVTIISRNTKYRRILNEGQMVNALKQTGLFEVTVARFDSKVTFREQISLSHNTDILVGIHGAGLTHLIFLPDWAQVFELYNCDDAGCYYDLARLRGVGYTTHDWIGADGETKIKSHQVPGGYQGPAHKKFQNYEFDSSEFVKLMLKIREKVINHSQFSREREHKHEQAINHVEL